jgi:hypothetical protein
MLQRNMKMKLSDDGKLFVVFIQDQATILFLHFDELSELYRDGAHIVSDTTLVLGLKKLEKHEQSVLTLVVLLFGRCKLLVEFWADCPDSKQGTESIHYAVGKVMIFNGHAS